MSKEKEKPETREFVDPGLFEEALNNLSDTDKGSLGDPEVVETILRHFIAETLPLVMGGQDELDQIGVHQLAQQAARIFLGEDAEAHHPVPGWNKPGSIDAHVAKYTGVDEKNPEDRIVGALLRLLHDIVGLVGYHAQQDTLEEQVKFQIEGIFQTYTGIFMGLTLAQINEQ